MHRFLIIQTAFTGDVVLATALGEKLHKHYPTAQIDYVVRKGNEGLLNNHPYINKVWVWDKKTNKNKHLLQLALSIRQAKYTHVINPHRFAASGLLSLLSGAAYRSGFTKNPLSFSYTHKYEHHIANKNDHEISHEVARNQLLIKELTDSEASMPALYPSANDYAQVKAYQKTPYICIAPTSVWFTKQFPAHKWVDLIKAIPEQYNIYLIGAPSDKQAANEIMNNASKEQVYNLCGELNFLQSAALMKNATMNYTNDSAPLHFASAINAPLTAVFCSTVPRFGFGPLRPSATIVETSKELSCRPCGLHGHRACPQQHFECANSITNQQLLWWTLKTT